MNGNPKRIDILQKGFSGSVTNLIGTDISDIKINYGNVDTSDKTNNILGGSITIGLMSDTFQEWLTEFESIDEQEFRIRLYDDPSGSNTLVFQGFVIPGVYTEPFETPAYASELTAVDGIGDLKTRTYTNTQWNSIDGWQIGQKVTGQSSIKEILQFCLEKTGLEQPIRIATNVYASGTDSPSEADGGNETGDANDDPLNQVFISNDSFIVDDVPLDCYEVIRRVLRSLPEPCILSSYEGKWWIVPIENTGTLTYREFAVDGTIYSNSTTNPIVDFPIRVII
jgi:hypothetical protein